jgi:allantoin racemase
MKLAYHRITPVTAGPYVDLLEENIRRAKRSDTEVDLKGPKRSIGVFQSVYRSFRFYNDREVLESMWDSYREGYDAIALNCFFDPCVDVAREMMDIPVVGPAEASMSMASLMGARFGLVTFHPKTIPDYERMIGAYGFDAKAVVRPVRSLTQGPDDQLRGVTNPDPTIEDFRETATALVRDGAEVIIPACLMLSPILVKNGITDVDNVPVMDVVSVTVKFAEFLHEISKAGLPIVSRHGLYQGPDRNLLDEVRSVFGLASDRILREDREKQNSRLET